VRFAKPPASIDQQIDLLQRRGMQVPDRERAAHYLLHLNYYRLRGYWLPFECGTDGDGDHRFQAGTTFEHVLDRYVFDRELRLLVMDAIERIEVSVRTQWAHHLALGHGSHAHLSRALFSDQRAYTASLGGLANEVGRSRETFIQHLNDVYDEALPPVWAVVEVMSLGQLSKWYENLKCQALRQRIADGYGMDETVFVSLLHHLTLIRNVCAHHSRLWNRRFTITPKLPRKKPTGLTTTFNTAAPRQLYNALVLIAYLMNIVSPGHHWKQRLLELLEQHSGIPVESMGFPDGWRDLPYWAAEVRA
jgi:abortive infection bacteriophage resistance protein